MARVWDLKSTDMTQTEESTYSVGSSPEVTSVNSPFRGDASRASSFHLALSLLLLSSLAPTLHLSSPSLTLLIMLGSPLSLPW